MLSCGELVRTIPPDANTDSQTKHDHDEDKGEK
jgi:hypothetical protein